jgi:K+-transporting ATPase A subunit
MRLNRLLLPLCLVFALLFAQQGAATHGIEHTLAEQSQDQSLPHHQHCDLCAVYAQIGSAIGSSHVSFDFTSSFEESLFTHSVSFRSIAFSAFAARAPPFTA